MNTFADSQNSSLLKDYYSDSVSEALRRKREKMAQNKGINVDTIDNQVKNVDLKNTGD